jgi:hypothetical protein
VGSPRQQARADVLDEARRQPWNRPGVQDTYRIADFIRGRYRLAARIRARVTALCDTPAAWDLAAAAATIERQGLATEAEFDEALA